ncbi:regulatory protein GemA [Thauera sinica]|uniref:Phage protein GemA/Gp16 family protein n=1 Tax=Thauera sinica TaxID=2665146 RepID=A0ABW1AYH8_9RHOO|nr:regulatory protein GemA [Thauera sp. K11]ATE60136.1 hypothetical protein CCZ27_09415 [Thauera sp. K11]
MASAPFAAARQDQRKRLIRTIQTGRSRLGLDDNTYRDLLAAKSGGKRSAADLAVHQLEAVLKHMRAAGFEPQKPVAAKPREHRKLDDRPEARKARALWLWLHGIGIVRDPSESALTSFARRTCGGVDALQWARRPDKLVEGIKAWSARLLPAKLDARIASMQATGKLPLHITRQSWIGDQFPTRDPAAFATLQLAWQSLDEVDRACTY